MPGGSSRPEGGVVVLRVAGGGLGVEPPRLRKPPRLEQFIGGFRGIGGLDVRLPAMSPATSRDRGHQNKRDAKNSIARAAHDVTSAGREARK
jgi:hypothetical protein